MIPMTVGEGNGFHGRQIYSQDVCIVDGTDFGKSRVEQDGVG